MGKMDNQEVLERNKSRAPADEGMVYQENRARGIGISCMIVLLAGLIVYNFFMGLQSYSLQTILWAYIGIEALCKYRHSQNKIFLITGVAGTLASVVFLVNYIMMTW